MAENTEQTIPAICADRSSMAAYHVLNPNEWERDSRAVVQACATEYSMLIYSSEQIAEICSSAKERCRSHFLTLRQQWDVQPWDLSRMVYFGQLPELHVLIEAFFSGMKSLLDLLVQLISTEGVVRTKLHGFHRVKKIYGGSVLNTLERNVCAGKEALARDLRHLIGEHKKLWIDEVIGTRDQLVHPTKGTHHVMFQMVLETNDGRLIYRDARPPYVGSERIDSYSASRLESMKQFAKALSAHVRISIPGA